MSCDQPNLARYYDAVVPWKQRLARELPLLEQVGRAAGGRVLVPACGTGGHVLALAQRGFSVLGFDVDAQALEIARQKLEAGAVSIRQAQGDVELMELSMEDAARLGPAFGAAFCLGNALPGLSLPGQLRAALGGVAAALQPRGVFLTQNLNYDKRWKQRAHYFPVLAGQTEEEEVLLVKFADYEPEVINFHAQFITRPKGGGSWRSEVRTSRQIPLFYNLMTRLLAEAGLGELQAWGDYSQSPFDPEASNDLILAAKKA